MDLENLTLKQVKEIQSALRSPKESNHPFKVGEKYFIRTATFFQLGRLKEIKGKWLILEEASWIADTGRFHEFLRDGKCNEYESFTEDVYVPLDSVIDITVWTHSLFKGNK